MQLEYTFPDCFSQGCTLPTGSLCGNSGVFYKVDTDEVEKETFFFFFFLKKR